MRVLSNPLLSLENEKVYVQLMWSLDGQTLNPAVNHLLVDRYKSTDGDHP